MDMSVDIVCHGQQIVSQAIVDDQMPISRECDLISLYFCVVFIIGQHGQKNKSHLEVFKAPD